MTNEPLARVCIGKSVKGDLHDIAKNLVIMMLKGAGVRGREDWGVDVLVEEFEQAVRRGKIQVVCLSALDHDETTDAHLS
ncbi:MAG: cobalamin B12-binding domain-containing protein [Defluviimonas sp.]|nr:cobalamin B12-binding domain-containing protein [Defluviimonas sp.]